jgi:hypothetical protein
MNAIDTINITNLGCGAVHLFHDGLFSFGGLHTYTHIHAYTVAILFLCTQISIYDTFSTERHAITTVPFIFTNCLAVSKPIVTTSQNIIHNAEV